MKAEIIDNVHLGDTYVLITTSDKWPHSSFSNQHMVVFKGGSKSALARAFAALINDIEGHNSLPAVKALEGIE